MRPPRTGWSRTSRLHQQTRYVRGGTNLLGPRRYLPVPSTHPPPIRCLSHTSSGVCLCVFVMRDVCVCAYEFSRSATWERWRTRLGTVSYVSNSEDTELCTRPRRVPVRGCNTRRRRYPGLPIEVESLDVTCVWLGCGEERVIAAGRAVGQRGQSAL